MIETCLYAIVILQIIIMALMVVLVSMVMKIETTVEVLQYDAAQIHKTEMDVLREVRGEDRAD